MLDLFTQAYFLVPCFVYEYFSWECDGGGKKVSQSTIYEEFSRVRETALQVFK